VLWFKKKKIKKSTKKETKKKTEKKKKDEKVELIYIYLMILYVFRNLVAAFVKLFPEDTVVKAYKMIESEFIKLKEPTISIMERDYLSIEQREEIWKEIAYHTSETFSPMYEIVSKIMAANLNKKEEIKEEIMEESIANIISGLGRRSASDIAKIKSRLIAPDSDKSLVVPMTLLDSCSDSSLISNSLAKRLDIEIDKSKTSPLRGIATKTDTVGIIDGLGVSIYDEDNEKVIEDDFLVIDNDKNFLLLGITWLDRAGAILDFKSRVMKIPIS
jgi:hypothetical protein